MATNTYQIRTDYFGLSNVDFSVSINEVPVGAYNSGGVIADITRFVKPGVNEVHIAWIADPAMGVPLHATLLIEQKRGEKWFPIITREVNRDTKSGEVTSRFSDTASTPQ